MTNQERLALRRETKFEEFDIEIRDEAHTEIRKGETLEFNHAVYVQGRLEGRTATRRSALKRGHQVAHNLRERGFRKPSKRRSK